MDFVPQWVGLIEMKSYSIVEVTPVIIAPPKIEKVHVLTRWIGAIIRVDERLMPSYAFRLQSVN